MSSETLEVQKREHVGSLASKKLRREGGVPAILYGHGEENVNLTVKADAIGRIIQHGTKLLSLTGAVKDTALLKDVQWDTFGIDVLHIDLTRVSTTEKVEVTLPVELHGEAPGTSEGGQLVHAAHELTISCPAANIPEHLVVHLSGLHLGDAIHAGEIELPEGAEMITPAADVVVQITKPAGVSDSDSEDSGIGAEPEVISKGKGDEEDANG